MSKRRLVITAVLTGQSQSEVARAYGVSQGWVSRLMARYAAEGEDHLEHELRERNITQKNGKPNHPQTQGKVERFQQTLKKWLRAQPTQPTQPATLAELQALVDTFVELYNTRRPHRSLPKRATPASIYTSLPKSQPHHRPGR